MKRYVPLAGAVVAAAALFIALPDDDGTRQIAQFAETTGDVVRITDANGETFDAVLPVTIDTTTTTTLPPTTTSSTTTTTTTVAPQVIVIDTDTVITEAMTLRAGDSIEFSNGARLSFVDGGFADWQGTETETWSDDGTVQNLVRDINITGQGDIRFEAGSLASVIRYVNIDLQPTVELGSYPLHWHFAGDGSRGTLVEGVVIQNSTNRAFVPHASHGIVFKDTIAKDTIGIPYWWDLPDGTQGLRRNSIEHNSHGIEYLHTLADGVSPSVFDNQFTITGYLLGAGGDIDQDGLPEDPNVVRDSVAMNITGQNNCSGFRWPSHANGNIGGNQWVFTNNATFNACNGIFVWQNDHHDGHIVDGFRAVNVNAGIDHGAYVNHYTYLNIDVDIFEAHALDGTHVGSGRIGLLEILRHSLPGSPITFTDVQIGGVTIDNTGPNNGGNPGTYLFDNTGLTCGDIVVVSIVPGTTATIDGEECTL